MSTNRSTRSRFLITSLLICAGALWLIPATSSLAIDVVYSGIDVWRTPPGEHSFTDFAHNPIPADFFCAGSEPFTGKVYFRGAPILTGEGSLPEGIDTVIQRLDDAVFDAEGTAVTRLQVQALSLVSTRPLVTSCGNYTVTATLHGEQPVTEMTIFRDDEQGGTFSAPLALDVLLTFSPLSDGGALTLTRSFTLRPGTVSVWSTGEPDGFRRPGFLKLDTDQDAIPDLYVPGTSNFVAGRASTVLEEESGEIKCCTLSCHCTEVETLEGLDPEEFGCSSCGHLHCVEVQVACTFRPGSNCNSQVFQCGATDVGF